MLGYDLFELKQYLFKAYGKTEICVIDDKCVNYKIRIICLL